MSYSLTWLLNKPLETITFLHFWGHTPKQTDAVDKSCFSQWFPAAFDVAGTTYPTAEHWMMAEKARLFGDEAVRRRILTARTPGEAKQLGRQVKNFEPAAWDAVKFELVQAGNHAKFSQHAALREYLLATGERVLVEASPVDAVWGSGRAADHPDAGQPARWPGENLLGFALMAVRDQLRTA